MLGALVKATDLVSIESVMKSMEERFAGPLLEKNIELIKKSQAEAAG